MPTAATTQAARPTPTIVDHRADASGHALMAARTTSTHSRALEAWICALLMALMGHIEPMRQFFPHIAQFDLPEDEEAALRLIRHAIRAENRLRARVAWLVRQHPNRGMRRTVGQRAPELPLRTPRPPPNARQFTPNPLFGPRHARRWLMPKAQSRRSSLSLWPLFFMFACAPAAAPRRR